MERCTWNPFELSDVCISIVQVAYEGPSPCFDGQIVGLIVLGMATSTRDNDEGCRDQTIDKHLQDLVVKGDRNKRGPTASRAMSCRSVKDPP